jgi:hypothetical protein
MKIIIYKFYFLFINIFTIIHSVFMFFFCVSKLNLKILEKMKNLKSKISHFHFLDKNLFSNRFLVT